MSLARAKVTGSGQLSWRVSIDGWPEEFVSSKRMETTVDGRPRYVGLRSDGFSFKEEADPVTAGWKAGALTIEIVDVAGRATQSFDTAPTAVAYMTQEHTHSVTTLTVAGTSRFASSGYLHCDTEAIAYSGTTATTFTGLTRGKWNTLAQYHYAPDGERLGYVEVTDRPVILEGRRVRVYAYGSGDSPTGDGTLVWLGKASTGPKCSGPRWSFMVDSIASVLDVEVGGELSDPAPIRGIYYPRTAPLIVVMREGVSATYTDGVATTGKFAIAGFWESQADFLAALQTAIDAELSRASFTSTDVQAVPIGEQWGIQFTTASSGQIAMRFHWYSATDLAGALFGSTVVGTGEAQAISEANAVAASTSYTQAQATGEHGTVPRTTLGAYVSEADAADLLETQRTGMSSTANPPWRLYIGGGATVSTNLSAARMDWTGREGDPSGEFDAAITATDASARYIEIARSGVPMAGLTGRPFNATASNVPSITAGRGLGSGTLADLITTLTGATARWLNMGATPDIQAGDFGTLGEITEAAGDNALSQRLFSAFEAVELKELIEHECRLIGVYPALDANGKITFRRLRLPAASEVASVDLTSATVLTDEGFPPYERNSLGLFNTVEVSTGYDAREEKHYGDTYRVRDVSGFGQSPNSRTLVIKPKSREAQRVSYEDAVAIGRRVTGVYGGSYATVTVEVPALLYFDTLVGSVVRLTLSQLPAGDGTRGMSNRIGIVLSKELEPMSARGVLTLFVTDQRIGGYVPAATIAGISGTTGTTGPFSFVVASSYLPGGLQAADVWAAGDKIRLYLFDSTTTTNNVTGTVSSVTASSMTITTDTNWTYGASSWCIGSQVSTSISALSQQAYAYLADSAGLVTWSGSTAPAFTFAP